jgi:hypothetical protein
LHNKRKHATVFRYATLHYKPRALRALLTKRSFEDIMKKTLVFISLLVTSLSANAIIVENVKINMLYVQSPQNSGAHAVSINKSIDPLCAGRMYVNFEDRELFSTLLAYKLSEKEFNLMYEIGTSEKVVAGHLFAKCHLFSIY